MHTTAITVNAGLSEPACSCGWRGIGYPGYQWAQIAAEQHRLRAELTPAAAIREAEIIISEHQQRRV